MGRLPGQAPPHGRSDAARHRRLVPDEDWLPDPSRLARARARLHGVRRDLCGEGSCAPAAQGSPRASRCVRLRLLRLLRGDRSLLAAVARRLERRVRGGGSRPAQAWRDGGRAAVRRSCSSIRSRTASARCSRTSGSRGCGGWFPTTLPSALDWPAGMRCAASRGSAARSSARWRGMSLTFSRRYGSVAQVQSVVEFPTGLDAEHHEADPSSARLPAMPRVVAAAEDQKPGSAETTSA